MSISVDGLELFPKSQMEALLAEFTRLRASRVRQLVGDGIIVDRISIVTLAGCAKCRGSGVVLSFEHHTHSVSATLSECPDCPGVCVDGAPIVEKAQKGLDRSPPPHMIQR